MGLLDFAIPYLREKQDLVSKFAVIDQKRVWYGGVNLLGYSNKDNSEIRLTDSWVALALLKALLESIHE